MTPSSVSLARVCGYFVTAALMGPTTLAPAQEAGDSQELSGSQRAMIEEYLHGLQDRGSKLLTSRYVNAAKAFQEAAGSNLKARQLYENCYKETRFGEGLSFSEKDFRDWQNDNQGLLSFDPFLDAIRIQLEYLILLVRASQAEDLSPLIGDLTAFARRITAIEKPIHPYLDDDAAKSVFAEAYKLHLAGLNATWALNPLQVGGMYEKTILPFLRSQNPDLLERAWNERIQLEAALAQKYLDFWKEMERYQEHGLKELPKSLEKVEDPALIAELNRRPAARQELASMARFAYGKAQQARQFLDEGLSQLRWNQLMDRYTYGPAKAKTVREMIDHVEKNLGNPSSEGWIEQLKGIVSGQNPPVPPAPGSSGGAVNAPRR